MPVRSLMLGVLLGLLFGKLCKCHSKVECKTSRFKPGHRPVRSMEQQLLFDLLCKYDKEARPVLDTNDTIIVVFNVKLIQVVDVIETKQIMQTNVWITQQWYNPLLSWNSKEYNNITKINLEAQNVWVPTILLYNNAEKTFSGGPKKYRTKVILDSSGKHTWFAAVSFKSSCKFNVRNFPFDEQECLLTFGSWAYSIDKLDIRPATPKGDLSEYITNGEWELVDLPAVKVEEKYACCKYRFAEVIYRVRMRRKVLYYLFNLILPCTIIACLALLAFCIPPVSGQRITLSITVMLAMSVFLNFAWTRLPVTSESVPLLATYYMLTMLEIGLSLFANAVALTFYYRDNACSYLPHCCRVTFIGWLAKRIAAIFCMQHPSETSRLSRIIKQYIKDEQPRYSTTSQDQDSWRSHSQQFESIVTVMDNSPEDSRMIGRRYTSPKVKITQTVKRNQPRPFPSKSLFLKQVLQHTTSHALTAEPSLHYTLYKAYRQCRDEDDVDVLVGNTVENALLKELEDHKHFIAMIIDRFFLIVFLLTIALSFTALLSGDTASYMPES